MAETVTPTISVLTSCDPWTSAIDKYAFRPCSWQLETIELSTNETADPDSHIASKIGLKSVYQFI